MKLWSALFCILICAPTMAAQTIDPRQYVDWSKCEFPYNQLVKLNSSAGFCTAQFVAPDIVATALHCIASTKTGKLKNHIRLRNCHGDVFSATIVDHADIDAFLHQKPISRNDWALLRVDDPRYYSQNYFNIDNEQSKPNKIPLTNISYTGDAIKYDDTQYPGFVGTSAGWGALPILSDEEIQQIKSELIQRVKQKNNGSQYNIDSQGAGALYANGYFEGIVKDDDNKLKIHNNCIMYPDFAPYNWTPEHKSTCLIWAGNSGGAFYTESDNTLHGVASTSVYMLPNQNIHDNIALVSNYAPTRQIYQLAKQYSNPKPIDTKEQKSEQTQTQTQAPQPEKQVVPNTQTLEQNNQKDTTQQKTQVQTQKPRQGTQDPTKPNNTKSQTAPETTVPDTVEPDDTTELEENIQTLGDNIDKDLQNINNMSDKKFLMLLGNIADYNALRQKYEQAKAREQSIPNKLLGGLSMAATGIGGMQLASGLAEQAADDEAERAMRAYLATFMCDYGAGRNITGGTTGIELPGANALIEYRTEYMNLATSLKATKESLNMMPGIESETVFDAASTGLYDNVGIGTQPGAFTSLSRALMDENSNDAKAWAAQKQSAHDKKNTGLTIGATGAGAGIAGNVVINKFLNKDNKSTNNNKSDTQQPSVDK